MANILQKAIRYIGGFLTQNSSLTFPISKLETYTNINTQNVIEKGFNSNTAVYSIVMKDAGKFGSIPRYVYDSSVMEEKARKGVKRKEIKAGQEYLNNDLSKLLNRPNPYESQDAFFAKVRAYYKVTGEAFIWLNRGDGIAVDQDGQLVEMDEEAMLNQPILEMHVLPSDKIIVIADPDDIFGVKDYILELNGRRQRLGKANVIHWKMIHVDFDEITGEHLRGRAPLISGYKTLQANNDATNSEVRMYQNDGSKGVLTNESFDKLAPDQKSQIQRVIDSKINNNDVKGAIATLQGKWDYKSFGGSSVDMQLLQGKELSWKEMCFLLDVPYEFFDSHTPFAEKQLTQVGWITNTMMPATKQLDGELNRVLPRAFKLQGKAFIACDYWDLPEMQEVRLKKAEGLMKIWPITPNQVLQELGYEKRPEPEFDMCFIPSGLQTLEQMNDEANMERANQLLSQYDNGD